MKKVWLCFFAVCVLIALGCWGGEDRPMLIISYDDGRITDYTRVFPVHQKHSVPAELCIVSDWVGTEGFATKEQLIEMQSAGFEMVSHGKRHETLQSSVIQRPVTKGDTKIYSLRADRFHAATRCIIQGDKNSELAIVRDSGKDSEGHYVVMKEGVKFDYPVGSIVRITDEEAIQETKDSKEALEAMGLKIRHYSYP